jgi:hypothetical protein
VTIGIDIAYRSIVARVVSPPAAPEQHATMSAWIAIRINEPGDRRVNPNTGDGHSSGRMTRSSLARFSGR